MALYPIASGWDIEVLDEARGWCRGRSGVTLPAPSVLTGYGALSGSEYQVQARFVRELRWPSEPSERAFLHFDGLLHGATVLLDGVVVGTSRGGYGAERFEVTHRVPWGGTSTLVVEVDSRERADIPPFGRPPGDDCPSIDFHAFGGISRAPAVEFAPAAFVANARALPKWGSDRVDQVDVTCFLDWLPPGWGEDWHDVVRLDVSLVQDGSVLAEGHSDVAAREREVGLSLDIPTAARMWSPEAPALADLRVSMSAGENHAHLWKSRIGLRVVAFEADGLYLNGRHHKVRGLSRHELYPYLGPCVPSRLHHLDARTIKEVLGCNLVRTAHYPQSPAFLEACDEAGLMVFEETPGWGYLGAEEWREVVCRDVASMVSRDWNHPSVVMWGIRCNEAPHDQELYSRTNDIAHGLDPSRPTGGARVMGDYAVPVLEDVSCFNDYAEVPLPANHQPYLITEFVGAITPANENGHVYHRTGSMSELMQQGLRHARFYDGVCANDGDGLFAGGIGWVAFDYQSSCGSKRRWRDVKTPGVCDLFRVPKLAAGFYSSQREISQGVVVESNFVWDEEVPLGGTGADEGSSAVWVWTNADAVRAIIDGTAISVGEPDWKAFPHLPHPPARVSLPASIPTAGILTLQALVGNTVVKERNYDPSRQRDIVYTKADDVGITGDGCDTTRVVVGIGDRFANPRYVHGGVLQLEVEGPGEIIGPNELDLAEVGGIAATFVSATAGTSGKVRLTARCKGVGSATAEFEIKAPVPERL